MSILDSIRDFSPSKGALAWAAGGASALTIAVGFTLGGWVTGGTADKMVRDARTSAQTELAAAVCAANFRQYPLAQTQHAQLVGLTATRQRQFVQDQPWSQVPGAESVNRAVADACARLIAQMDPADLGEPAAS